MSDSENRMIDRLLIESQGPLALLADATSPRTATVRNTTLSTSRGALRRLRKTSNRRPRLTRVWTNATTTTSARIAGTMVLDGIDLVLSLADNL